MWSLMVLSLPCATSAHHPPGSLEAVACSQVLKPRVGPAGVYTLPALMSLTGSNINMSRFGQASRFSFFSFLFFPAHIPAAISTLLKVRICCPRRRGVKGRDAVLSLESRGERLGSQAAGVIQLPSPGLRGKLHALSY